MSFFHVGQVGYEMLQPDFEERDLCQGQPFEIAQEEGALKVSRHVYGVLVSAIERTRFAALALRR